MEEDFVIELNEKGEKVLVKCNVNEGTAIIPDGVVHIGSYAFKNNCVNKVIVPSSVRTIKNGAFYYCKMKEIVLSEGLEVIEKEAFDSCQKLTSVIIPHGVKSIGRFAFSMCSNLKKIFIPETVEVMEENVFSLCMRLKIYLEGKPAESWVNGSDDKITYSEDVTEGFNFHRSAGSFDDSYVVTRSEYLFDSFNPERRPVYFNVSLEDFLKFPEEE
ncbi:MAG: leucine-rich repeat domain-containing protein [Candidatus Coproplasma sp.]